MLTFFGLAACPASPYSSSGGGISMPCPRRMGKAGSRADGPPCVESSARRTSGDTGTVIAGYFFDAFPPALSLCFSFETELCFSLVARGSGLERGDFY